MRAVVLEGPGPAATLQIRDLPIPEPKPGWVLIAVHAFGLNRSELHTRLGLAGPDVRFPRVLGIEAAGIVEAAPTRPDLVGKRVVAMMGGMGRAFDGGYAEYTSVPEACVVEAATSLDWPRLGALPEVLQTAWGSLTAGVGLGVTLGAGGTLLVRGGTSSVGMMAALLAKRRQVVVIATTRSEARRGALAAIGVDHPIVDDGAIADRVRDIAPGGVDGAIELVGAPTLRDTLRATRPQGTVCFTGMLSNQWIIDGFYPIDFIPTGVRLTAYAGGAADLPAAVLTEVADAIACGELSLPIEVYPLDEIVRAHEDMEHDRVAAKQVVVCRGGT